MAVFWEFVWGILWMVLVWFLGVSCFWGVSFVFLAFLFVLFSVFLLILGALWSLVLLFLIWCLVSLLGLLKRFVKVLYTVVFWDLGGWFGLFCFWLVDAQQHLVGLAIFGSLGFALRTQKRPGAECLALWGANPPASFLRWGLVWWLEGSTIRRPAAQPVLFCLRRKGVRTFKGLVKRSKHYLVTRVEESGRKVKLKIKTTGNFQQKHPNLLTISINLQ